MVGCEHNTSISVSSNLFKNRPNSLTRYGVHAWMRRSWLEINRGKVIEPDVGSSRKMICDFPVSAIPRHSFRLLPPLRVLASLSFSVYKPTSAITESTSMRVSLSYSIKKSKQTRYACTYRLHYFLDMNSAYAKSFDVGNELKMFLHSHFVVQDILLSTETHLLSRTTHIEFKALAVN